MMPMCRPAPESLNRDKTRRRTLQIYFWYACSTLINTCNRS